MEGTQIFLLEIEEHKMIDTRLKVFRSVATLLSFTKAANELFISQPAISKHIQELEMCIRDRPGTENWFHSAYGAWNSSARSPQSMAVRVPHS